jgi:hypothetical protein
MAFGNPFRKDVPVTEFHNEKCRWCLQKIGAGMRYPLPLCDTCFMSAYNHSSRVFCCSHPSHKEAGGPSVLIDAQCEHRPPGKWPGNIWERMCTEFDREFRIYLKRSSGTSLTPMDVVATALEVQQEITDMKKALKQASLANDTFLMERLTDQIASKTKMLAEFRTELPKQIAEYEKAESEGVR